MAITNYWDVADTIAVGIDPYRALSNAIIMLALTEYQDALIDCYMHKQTSNEVTKRIEVFFNSYWFTMISTLDGPYVIRKAKKEIRETAYPNKIQERVKDVEFRKEQVADTVSEWWAKTLLEKDTAYQPYKVLKKRFKSLVREYTIKALDGVKHGTDSIIVTPYQKNPVLDYPMDVLSIDRRWFPEWVRYHTMIIDTYTVRIYNTHAPNTQKPQYILNLDNPISKNLRKRKSTV